MLISLLKKQIRVLQFLNSSSNMLLSSIEYLQRFLEFSHWLFVLRVFLMLNVAPLHVDNCGNFCFVKYFMSLMVVLKKTTYRRFIFRQIA